MEVGADVVVVVCVATIGVIEDVGEGVEDVGEGVEVLPIKSPSENLPLSTVTVALFCRLLTISVILAPLSTLELHGVAKWEKN